MLNKMKLIINLINNKETRIDFFVKHGFYKNMQDKKFIEMKYKAKINKKLNLDNPITFNEKIQWLKLYDRNPEYTKMVDKYEAKKYVSDIIGQEYIIPTIGVYDKFEDIDFDKLPNRFVLKCTHDCGGVIVCQNKNSLDLKKIKNEINRNLKRNFFYSGREWPYKNVKPRIIIEKYMIDDKQKELRDYKIFCFNGKAKLFKIDFDRFNTHKANYFDTNLNLLPFGEVVCPSDFNKKLEIPNNIEKMFRLAEILSKGTKFLRVDFYNVNGKIFFGEMTFFPASGFGKFEPEEYDKILGDMLELQGDNIKEKNEK